MKKNLKEKIKSFYFNQFFKTGIVAFFINSSFIANKGLKKEIIKNAGYMRGTMLDFGCGKKPYRELFNVDKYVGLDIKITGYEYGDDEVDVFYDGKKIPFNDNYFDSIFSSEVLIHVPNLDEILKELNRVLKTDGSMLLTTPFLNEEIAVGHDYWRFTLSGLEKIMKDKGFEVLYKGKSTSNVGTLFQLFLTGYLHRRFPKNDFFRFFCVLIFVPPLNLLGAIFDLLLPQKGEIYRSNVVVAKKIKHL